MQSINSLSLQLPEAEGILIVPPFSRVEVGVSGVHILQACASKAGRTAGVFYANIVLARCVGLDQYNQICTALPPALLGERIFAKAAFGTPASPETFTHLRQTLDKTGIRLSATELAEIAEFAAMFADRLGRAIGQRGYRWVGATTCFQQNCAAIALLSAVKATSPHTITLLGGGNCDGEMARGLLSLPASADYIFSGEAESTFVDFLCGLDDSRFPPQRIVEGTPCQNMDSVPAPDYSEYIEQLQRTLPEMPVSEARLVYETCRGCWKGAKSRCTFCGLRGTRVECDEKSPDLVMHDLQQMLAGAPTRHVVLADNIMPESYHKTLVPRLKEELPNAKLVWYQRSNLNLRQMKNLCDAGIRHVRAGVESLSTPVLKLMRKGVVLRQNLAVLRYARSLRMGIAWNLLYGFPGDDAKHYVEMLKLMPLIRHLGPPSGVTEIEIDRFSPYYDDAERYGITELAALDGYRSIYPASSDFERLAYTFQARYRSGSRDDSELVERIVGAVGEWRRAWMVHRADPPVLTIEALGDDKYLLEDTRGLPDAPRNLTLTREEAQVALTAAPLNRAVFGDWAIERRLAVARDGWCLPLATADYEILLEFETRSVFESDRAQIAVAV